VTRIYFTDHWSRPEPYVARRAGFWKRIVANSINLPTTAVIAVSDHNRRCITATGLMARNRVRRIYDAVDLSRASPDGDAGAAFRRKHSIPLECPLVVQVGRISPQKGFPDLLEAARLVLAQDPSVRFAFVGEGPYRNEYMQQTRAMGLEDRVTWTCLVVDPLAEGVYAAADVVCQLSRWQEAFGLTIAEAMSCRKPLVATRVGGIPELVEDGATGFVVTPRDAGATAARILQLLGDHHLRERMGASGRKAVETNFSLKTNVGELLQLYGIDPVRDKATG
jgi:glycosyltransferase involved in cell wall biosynthesis